MNPHIVPDLPCFSGLTGLDIVRWKGRLIDRTLTLPEVPADAIEQQIRLQWVDPVAHHPGG